MKILVVGDIHGEWNHLNQLINKKRPDIILQCGDFGCWPGVKFHRTRHDYIMGKKPIEFWPPKLNLQGAKLYWCPGNHENWWYLQENYGRRSIHVAECAPDVYYCPIGSIIVLPDGRSVMFMGGAESIDKDQRTVGFDWFPEEVLGYADVIDLPYQKVDIVISHTCPTEFDMVGRVVTAVDKFKDPSKEALSVVLNYNRPDLWYFGHYHKYATGYVKGCRWYALSMPTLTGWWKWLED